MSATDQITDVQDRVISSVEAAQSRVLELNRSAAETVAGVLPSDRVRIPTIERLPQMPDAKELVDNYFDFAARVAKANRAFAKEMVTIWTDLEAPKATAAKSTAKASTTKASTTKKSTAKKSTAKKGSKSA